MTMRVQCEVCGVEPAAVLCCADEAALCPACDGRVHGANKLAAKHRRLTLIHPSSASNGTAPLCEVCEERMGLLFCVEDRAILCSHCDVPMHSANQPTHRHSRFLLVSAKLSNEPDDRLVPGYHAQAQSDSDKFVVPHISTPPAKASSSRVL